MCNFNTAAFLFRPLHPPPRPPPPSSPSPPSPPSAAARTLTQTCHPPPPLLLQIPLPPRPPRLLFPPSFPINGGILFLLFWGKQHLIFLKNHPFIGRFSLFLVVRLRSSLLLKLVYALQKKIKGGDNTHFVGRFALSIFFSFLFLLRRRGRGWRRRGSRGPVFGFLCFFVKK